MALSAASRKVPVSVAYDAHGPCLAVPLACGRTALVGFRAGAEEQYQHCSISGGYSSLIIYNEVTCCCCCYSNRNP